MAVKTLHIENIGNVKIYKRRRMRTIRLGVTEEGEVRLMMPTWVSQRVALKFLLTKQAWIADQRQQNYMAVKNGMPIGKNYKLSMTADETTKIVCRIVGQQVRVRYPKHLNEADKQVQQAAKRLIVRALRREAEELLPPRLKALSRQHTLSYRSLRVRQLKSRWGSCNPEGDITLNLFLIQLPWELIDYVLLHELTHTEHFGHHRAFWDSLSRSLPETAALRREIRAYQPKISS